MKKKIYIVFFILLISSADFAQQVATGTAPAPFTNVNTLAQTSWYRGGNLGINPTNNTVNVNNIFGTFWNSPIYTETFGAYRTKLNGQFTSAATQYNINGWDWPDVNTTGYFLLGQDELVPTGGSIYTNKGAFAMFHISGGNQQYASIQELGYRPWMKYGTLITSNTDLMYVGHRAINLIGNQTDAVFQWSNDAAASAYGPDNMTFVYTQSTGTIASGTNNAADLAGNDFDGREIMRLTGLGNVGIGPRFNNIYQPTSTLHQHQQNAESSWMQITNQYLPIGALNINTGPTAITKDNGLRIGILGDATWLANGNAFMYNQENRHLIFSTNHITPTAWSTTNERLRITSVGAPTELYTGVVGYYNPAGLPNTDVTRVSISYNPADPVTRPLSLLHLGYNTARFAANPASLDGWRPWMNIGMYVSNGTDNVYLGMKNNEGAVGNDDRYDAVLSWGDNEALYPADGPDNFRIIFAASQTILTNVGQAINNDGLEAMRISPANPTPLTVNLYTGIGGYPATIPFQPNPYSANTANPQSTVEINSPATGTLLSAPVYPANTSAGYSTPNLLGGQGFSGLRFTDLTAGSAACTTFTTTNVLSVNDDGDVILIPGGTGIGICAAPTTFLAGTNGAIGLTNNNNFYFLTGLTATNNTVNNVAIGFSSCATPQARLDVLQTSTSTGTIGINVLNTDAASNAFNRSIGIRSIVNQPRSIAGWFNATDNAWTAIYVPENGGRITVGFPVNLAEGTGPANCLVQINGNAWLLNAIGTQFIVVSDSILKTNINEYTYGLDVVRKVKPITYNYNGKAMLPTNETFLGVSAEDIAAIPELAPFAVDTTQMLLETGDTIPTNVLTINNDAIFYSTINAIKELDSAVTILQNTTPPNKPILVSPADSATNLPLTIALTWKKSERATSYMVYVTQPRMGGNVGGIVPILLINTADTFTTITLPEYFSSYNWYVIAYNSAGSSDMSDQWSFTTLMPPVPSVVSLISPLNSVTDLPLANTFLWNKSELANNYTLFISTDMTYSNVVYIMNTADTMAYATVPNYGTKYYWWIIASNISGQSPESDKREFATLLPAPPPSAPLLISPANGDSLSPYAMSLNFVWNQSPGASNYSIYISTTPTVAGVIYSANTPNTFYNLPQIFGVNRMYYWWVVACNQYSCGVPSNVWHFFIKPVGIMSPLQSDATLSDSVLKTNVRPLDNAIALITQLQPVKYYWDTINNSWLPTTEQIGLVGQQVENIVPQVVFKDSAGYYNIQYGRLVALLVEGMKEQQQTITFQQSEIDSLKSVVFGTNQKSNENTGNSDSQSNMQYVELASENSIILNQNDPNPFAEETNITYFLSDDVSEAKILFYDNTGKIIKTVELIGRGNGTLHVYASNLSAGIYAYALIADSKVIDTKKMVCTKK
ncbi:MAG: tail fiber domain-containing protein [Bacteroidota bacterium]